MPEQINIKPFELSAWRDELVEHINEQEGEYLNVYHGLGVPEDDLRFWFLPRDWKSGSFNPINNSATKVHLSMKKPDERDESLVHLDFSTSILSFLPNTYYTFLMILDFKNGNVAYKKPSWASYSAVNPTADNHYLLTLLREEVPESMWSMPKPAFDSSVIIKYDGLGFNLSGTRFTYDYENAALFVDNGGSNGDIANADKVVLIACAKTNDFIDDGTVLGMWSFLEGWANDYWEADLQLYCFEDKIENSSPTIYTKLFDYYKRPDYHPIDDSKINQLFYNRTKKLFPDSDNNTINKNPFTTNSTQLQECKRLIDEKIRAYYTRLCSYLRKTYYSAGDANTNYNRQVTKLSSKYLTDYIIDYTDLDLNLSFSQKSATVGLEIVELLSKYISIFPFYYYYNNGNDNQPSYELRFFPYLSNGMNNFVNQYFGEYTLYVEYFKDFIIQDICLPISFKQLPNNIETQSERGAIYLHNGTSRETIEYTFIDDNGNSSNAFKDSVINFFDENFIESKIQAFWNKFFDNNTNKIQVIIDDSFLSDALRDDNPLKTDYGLTDSSNNLNIVGYEVAYTYANLLLLDDTVISQLTSYINKNIKPSNYSLDSSQFGYLLTLLGSWGLGFTTNNCTTNMNSGISFKHYNTYSFSQKEVVLNRTHTSTQYYHSPPLGTQYKNWAIEIANNVNDRIDILLNMNILTAPLQMRTNLEGLDIDTQLQNYFYLKEKKVCVFGSSDNKSAFAQNIILNHDTKNDINLLTFSLYYDYYNRYGEKEKNPFIPLLKEESKIKLKYEGKWYDFIIKEINLDSFAKKVDYIARDAFVSELSKIGFSKTFNTELDNNIGTIIELSDKVLDNTGWSINKDKTDTFYQSIKKNVIGGYLKAGYKIKCTSYYYDEELKKINLNNNYIIQNNDPNNRVYLYLFYEDNLDDKKTPKIICTVKDVLPYKQNYITLDNILTNVYLYPHYTVLDGNDEEIELKMINYEVLTNNNNYINTKVLNIFDTDEVFLNYSLRALNIVVKNILHYSAPLKRYVTEYIKTENNTNKIVYGYSLDSYTTSPLVQNLLPNGEDFTSLTGWITGSVNHIFSTKMTLGAATSGTTGDILPYINFRTSLESGSNSLAYAKPHGFVCNTALGLNYAALDHLTPKDNFTLRVQLERGQGYQTIQNNNNADIDDQLTLMESIHPHLYFYDDEYTLQNQYSTNILPRKEQQVINFYQEQKNKDLCAYNAGFLNNVTWGSYNSPSIGQSIYSLSDTMNKFGLVPIYCLKSNNEPSDDSPNIQSGIRKNGHFLKIYSGAFNDYLSDYPCTYITRNLAESWVSQSLLFRVNYVSGSGFNTTYAFTDTGYNNFIKMFKGDIDSDFNLRDFFIIADCSNSSYTQTRNILCNYILNASSTRLYYYLPMLFNDNELEQKLNELGYDGPYTKDTYNKKFFKINSGNATWQKVLNTKEYYYVTQINSKARAIPYNCDIEFDGANSETTSYPAKSDSTVYDDFTSIMRMRSVWRVKRYSENGTCIFETDGTFWGKIFKDQSNNYVFKTGNNLPSGYSYEDLNSQNLGLFFTIDSTKYDDGARGNAFATLSKIELFRTYKDENNELILPNKIIDTNTTPIYKFYDPEKNEKVTQEHNLTYDFIGTYIPDNYSPNIDYTGEKKNSITSTDSNCYNLLQKLAEIFDGWLNFDVLHNEDGTLILDENNRHKPIKKIYYTRTHYKDNYVGIRYGINLKKIQRKIDSNDLITKLIVKNNNNEFGINGFCSIARSNLNSNGTNNILKFEHLINTGLVPPEINDILYTKIYPRMRSLSKYLNNTVADLTHQSIIIAQEKAAKEYNEQLIIAAKNKFADFMEQYSRLNLSATEYSLAYYIANKGARDELPSDIQTIINSLMFYSSLISGFTRRTLESKNNYNDALQKYTILSNSIISVTKQRDAILEQFYDLCRGYIKEGAWSSEDYIDDDLYYLDAERQAEEYSVPRVTYTIDVIDLSSLPKFKDYTFNLRDKTFIEDPDVFGYYSDKTPVQEEIIITSKTNHLQEPNKNTITVQNYKTQFNDLFQRINSTIQAVEFGTLNYSNKNSNNDLNKRIYDNTLSIQVLQKINNK